MPSAGGTDSLNWRERQAKHRKQNQYARHKLAATQVLGRFQNDEHVRGLKAADLRSAQKGLQGVLDGDLLSYYTEGAPGVYNPDGQELRDEINEQIAMCQCADGMQTFVTTDADNDDADTKMSFSDFKQHFGEAVALKMNVPKWIILKAFLREAKRILCDEDEGWPVLG